MDIASLKTARTDRTLRAVTWPDNARCGVTFTFDFDAQTVFMAIKADATQVTQGEFGARVGIWRVLDLLDRYDVKATFFVPGLTAEMYPEAVKAIADKGHELGCHGYAHEGVQNLGYKDEVALFRKISGIIENVSGEKPRGWRKPGGQLSPDTLKILVDTGFTYIATGMADDIPYQWVVKDAPRNLTIIPFDWTLDDATFFFTTTSIGGGTISSPSAVYDIWSSEFDAQFRLGRYYNLTLHPFCIGRAHRLAMLERLVGHIRSHPEVWIAPCIDVVTYWEKTYPDH